MCIIQLVCNKAISHENEVSDGSRVSFIRRQIQEQKLIEINCSKKINHITVLYGKRRIKKKKWYAYGHIIKQFEWKKQIYEPRMYFCKLRHIFKFDYSFNNQCLLSSSML